MNKKIPEKLSATEEMILRLLIGGGEMYGLQLVQKSNGLIARGSVYVTLGRMDDKGLVESREEERTPGVSGIPRRLYRPTGVGQRVLRSWEQRKKGVLAGLTPAMG